jgi:hypothetical protein
MDRAQELRELAAWYRDFAERAGSPWIWEARLRRARELERGADLEGENQQLPELGPVCVRCRLAASKRKPCKARLPD